MFYCAGRAPERLGEWSFYGHAGRATAIVEVPPGVPSAAPVYLAALWFNRRGTGPLSTAVEAFVQPGVARWSTDDATRSRRAA